MKNEVKETPTIKQIVDSTGISPESFADHFRMDSRMMRKWYNEEKRCLEVVRDFLVFIIEEEKLKNKTED